MPYRIIAMPTAKADQFRQSRRDDFGNAIRPLTADADSGYFCRHCLAQAGKGRDALLASYDVPQPRGHFWQPSPVFVHAEACFRFEGDDEIPAALRAVQLINVRPYDGDDRLLYDLNDTTTGDRLEALLARCLADQRTRYVNVHAGRPGCFLCRVERL